MLFIPFLILRLKFYAFNYAFNDRLVWILATSAIYKYITTKVIPIPYFLLKYIHFPEKKSPSGAISLFLGWIGASKTDIINFNISYPSGPLTLATGLQTNSGHENVSIKAN